MTSWKQFKDFFIGNIHAYALQSPKSKWIVKRERVKKRLIKQHLKKEITIGSYNVYRRNNNICCKWICVEINLDPVELENGKKIDNVADIREISFPTKLLEKECFFHNKQELEDYYWDENGLIVYEKVSQFEYDAKEKLQKISVMGTPYYFREKYRINVSDEEKLKLFVHNIEKFLKKFYKIPKNAICREKSGNLYHIWIKLEDKTTLKRAYDFKLDIQNKLFSFFGVDLNEIFPKEDDLLNIYRCPRCGKKEKISIYDRIKFFECNRCRSDVKLESENCIQKGLGSFVKLPLSYDNSSNSISIILDENFSLKEQESFEIDEYVKELREKKRRERKYNDNDRDLDLSNWQPIDKDDEYFFYNLRYCMRKIVKGKQEINKYKKEIFQCLVNELFKLKAPLGTRIRALEQQTSFDAKRVKYKVQDLEMRARRANRYFVCKCSTIKKRGYCYQNCPEHNKYDLTPKGKRNIKKSQNNRCAICGISFNKLNYEPHTDHEHKKGEDQTGEVRGILCSNCNRALGYFKDNPLILLNAINYLKRNIIMELYSVSKEESEKLIQHERKRHNPTISRRRAVVNLINKK